MQGMSGAAVGLMFYGDPHGQWVPLYRAVEEHKPAAVVLLGDFELDEPTRNKLAPIWDMVPMIWQSSPRYSMAGGTC